MNNNIVIGVIVGALLLFAVGAFFIANKENGETGNGLYDTFAQCLYDSGMRMYGSATCKFCAQQREMFKGSFRFIREIECDPRNPFPQTELCISKNIVATPTWILEDGNGNDVKRFAPGVISLETLSEASGCSLVASTPINLDDSQKSAEQQ